METFDFVIVGGGSSGCVVAHRLSKSGRYSVLLLEAGGNGRRLDIAVPAGYARLFTDRNVNWMDSTDPVIGMDNRSVYLPSGQVLGGSGAINAMLYVRGNSADYDSWSDEGNVGWSFRDVLPYFQTLENTEIGDRSFRGSSGSIDIGLAEQHSLCDSFFKGMDELGVPTNPDYNGPNQEGVFAYQLTAKNGRRSSAASYLKDSEKRVNLVIRTGCVATRVTTFGRHATGVTYLENGNIREVRARREVVLACGALRSPQLLQLSGIGPGALLKEHGIEIVLDQRHVGRNLQDHASCTLSFKSSAPSLNSQLSSLSGKAAAFAKYVLAKKGPLASSLFSSGAFVKSREGLQRPDQQLIFIPASFTGAGQRKGGGFLDPEDALTLLVSPVQPTSRGHVSIVSPNPIEPPSISPNYFGVASDLSSMVDGLKFINRLVATPGMSTIIESPLGNAPEGNDDQSLARFAQSTAGSVFHPVGTCRMGPDQMDAVVDSSLRVHGVTGLRVVDASIMPSITSGNTNAPAMMIGERGAAFILEDAHNGANYL